jgi:hypothetical protein
MFDFLSPISDLFGTIAQWVGYGLIATFAVGSLFLLVVVPVMFKVAAVAFARVLVVETTNLIAKSGIATQVSNAVESVSKASNEITKQIQKQNTRNGYEVRVIEDVEVK